MKDQNCVFCKIINKEIPCYKVYEDANFLAFLDISPLRKGHTLLIPKNHTSDILDLDEENYTKLFLKTKELATKIKFILNSPRVGIAVEGFGVDHVHVHMIPISTGHQMNPGNAYKASKEELEEIQNLYLEIF